MEMGNGLSLNALSIAHSLVCICFLLLYFLYAASALVERNLGGDVFVE